MKRRDLLLALPFGLAACAPVLQKALKPNPAFRGPRFEGDRFISFDGARLALAAWKAEGQYADAPWAVIIGLHGMDDYSAAFHLAGPWWAGQGITTYAFDQRGFGRSPERGVWAGEDLMISDLRAACALARRLHPKAILAVAGESMGGAVALAAFASDQPPDADRLMIFGSRFDTLYGLVALMETAWQRIDRLKVPALYMYGAHDQIIPPPAAISAAARLRAPGRTLYYERGWHLLLRDLQAKTVWTDADAYIRAPAGPMPSGAPPIPKTVSKGPKKPDLPPGVTPDGKVHLSELP